MVTTKRSDNVRSSYYEHNQGGIGLLEKEAPASYNDYMGNTQVHEENLEQARERMQKNLDALLNYDKVEQKVQTTIEENVVEIKNEVDEDIRPSLTTMQFGDGDIDQMRSEMRVEENTKERVRITGKGKVAVALYSLAVTVILALIALNTGVLATLTSQFSSKSNMLDAKISEYSQVSAQVDYTNSSEYVEGWTNENNFVLAENR